jgi:hypothetical protein
MFLTLTTPCQALLQALKGRRTAAPMQRGSSCLIVALKKRAKIFSKKPDG